MKINFQYDVYDKAFLLRSEANKKARQLRKLGHPCHVAFDPFTVRYYVCYE